MNKESKLSIIMPNFNSFPFLKKTIHSIINQSYKNWELIIVDDCSDEKTKNFLKSFKKNKKIKVFFSKINRGAAYCRNFAIKKSNSKYLAFIDSDDIWSKNKLKLQLDFMEKNNFDFTYTYYETFGLKLKKIRPPIKLNFNDFTKNTSIATSTMILKKKIIKGIKFSNTSICEDYFFKCKILKKIRYAHCLEKTLTKYRIRKNSMQSSRIKNFYWIWKINHQYNNFHFFKNLKSLFFISYNSMKKYGLK